MKFRTSCVTRTVVMWDRSCMNRLLIHTNFLKEIWVSLLLYNLLRMKISICAEELHKYHTAHHLFIRSSSSRLPACRFHSASNASNRTCSDSSKWASSNHLCSWRACQASGQLVDNMRYNIVGGISRASLLLDSLGPAQWSLQSVDTQNTIRKLSRQCL